MSAQLSRFWVQLRQHLQHRSGSISSASSAPAAVAAVVVGLPSCQQHMQMRQLLVLGPRTCALLLDDALIFPAYCNMLSAYRPPSSL